ncbi:MAG: uroporphyrinogen decarboxylase family protein, partial [Planctomycetota bacterium]
MAEMTSKERVRAAFSHREPDRVPINYGANPGIDRRLKEHFGLEPDDGEGLLRALGVDFRGVGAPYRGPRLHEDVPERGVKVDNWGIHRRWVEHDTGGYWDYCDFPLGGATVDEVEAWPMPSPDDHDFSRVREACDRHEGYAVHVGNPGLGCIINSAGFLRGMEQVLVDLATDDPAGLKLVDRRLEVEFEVARRVIEAARGGVDFMWIGEDLGTQERPLIGM